jgi:3-hydroxybutyrate dehydrogenase
VDFFLRSDDSAVSLYISPMLASKVALVTGSTSGIGLEVLRVLAGQGANVCMHGLGDKDVIKANIEGIRALGAKVIYSDADLRKPEEIRGMVAQCVAAFGSLSILHNNAGIQHVAAVESFPEDKWNDIMDVCLNSFFHASKAAIPHMKKEGWGRIINTGSMHALVASPYKSAYNAAKHGVNGFTKTLALELARDNITVNSICPGYVLTDLIRNQIKGQAKVRGISEERVVEEVLLADQPTKSFVDTKDIAALVLHLCGPHSSSFTGSCISIDGGWTAR